MGTVEASVAIRASLAETWDYFFEPRGWPGWVDGYHATVSQEGYPEEGGTLRWRSVPAGRGKVNERVLDHELRRLHRVAFSDPESEGELATRFEIEPGTGDEPATRVTQVLDYRLAGRGPLAAITDALFIRAQMRRSLERSLLGLKHEVEELAALRGGGEADDREVGTGP